MQEAFRRGAFEGVMRNYRGELAECTTVQSVHRQERRGADAAARRRACCPASRASSCSRSAPDVGVPVREAVLHDDDLFGADEAFLTSTTREIVPIVHVDDRTIGTGTPGPVTRDAARRLPPQGAGAGHSIGRADTCSVRRAVAADLKVSCPDTTVYSTS